jgi:hypothetical protein
MKELKEQLRSEEGMVGRSPLEAMALHLSEDTSTNFTQ